MRFGAWTVRWGTGTAVTDFDGCAAKFGKSAIASRLGIESRRQNKQCELVIVSQEFVLSAYTAHARMRAVQLYVFACWRAQGNFSIFYGVILNFCLFCSSSADL